MNFLENHRKGECLHTEGKTGRLQRGMENRPHVRQTALKKKALSEYVAVLSPESVENRAFFSFPLGGIHG